jgi:hypothetical protein
MSSRASRTPQSIIIRPYMQDENRLDHHQFNRPWYTLAQNKHGASSTPPRIGLKRVALLPTNSADQDLETVYPPTAAVRRPAFFSTTNAAYTRSQNDNTRARIPVSLATHAGCLSVPRSPAARDRSSARSIIAAPSVVLCVRHTGLARTPLHCTHARTHSRLLARSLSRHAA